MHRRVELRAFICHSNSSVRGEELPNTGMDEHIVDLLPQLGGFLRASERSVARNCCRHGRIALRVALFRRSDCDLHAC
jgi:hypothetical protein